MAKYYCNPLNLPYKYNFQKPNMPGLGEAKMSVYREAADPTLELFKGRYYLFPSMTAGFYVSDDMVSWEYHSLPAPIPVFDYAPDVRAVGDWLYFSASKRAENCNFYRTRDPLSGEWEEIEGSFPFWDPDLFCDDDGRLYFYWGCSNITPIWGAELDRETLRPIGEKQVMFTMDNRARGYERVGPDHVSPKAGIDLEAATEEMFQNLMKMPPELREKEGLTSEEAVRALARGFAGDDPYIEGAYMTKHDGKYYLQYAFPETQSNVYGDGVLVSDHPLGPFVIAKNNPFSYKPGGFINGAGHGSTIADKRGNYWHTASMSISVNNDMERRLGLWKAGFDADGELWCDQRWGDWPVDAEAPAWSKPEWMLLSYGKAAEASSGAGAEKLTNENARDWWRAAEPGEAWCRVDLGAVMDVRAVQLNFADEGIDAEIPADADRLVAHEIRYIDREKRVTRWLLECSADAENWAVLADKREADANLCCDFVLTGGVMARYLKLTVYEMPFGQPATLSGLRVFGHGGGEAPKAPAGVEAKRTGELNMLVRWAPDGAVGHNVLWGHAPDKLYHSYMVLGADEKNIGALMRGEPVFVRVDAFNENGVAEGEVFPLAD
ncbi:MAG: family 43 glycosylhydrolase [Oscillospiraceae bacterium]|nr:family 43 glycosylhydrolase [Oscillospiraceae bacterium]